MEDLIRLGNGLLGKYEELLIRKDQICKEAVLYKKGYFREFGDLIIKVFEKKMECIRKKKTITFCQKARNHGDDIDRQALEEFLATAMVEYKLRLDELLDAKKNSRVFGSLTEFELLEIKKVYRRLAKCVHPDINPKTSYYPQLMELWQRAVTAYNCNDLKEIKEVEVLIQSAMKELGLGAVEVDIPDIEEKISRLQEEILNITSQAPYNYREILDNPDRIAEKHAELTRELKSYREYSAELDKTIEEIMIGEKITWQMN